MNVCVIPAFNRPEYLYICLQHIKEAENSDKLKYLFAIDLGADRKNIEVIKDFPFRKYIATPKPHKYKITKQSFNVMNGLLLGADISDIDMPDSLVFYIEDDVFIGKDFFTFHEKIHKNEPGLFCSILSQNVNGKDKVTNDPNAYYVKQTNQYQGIGSCYNSQMLSQYLTDDFNDEYFRYPKLYMKKHYPKSALDNNFCEQDGLIRRIIEKNDLKVAFSHVPRCFHAGFYGYHRVPKQNIERMKFKDKVDLIKRVAYNVTELKAIAERDYYVDDSLPVNLNTSHQFCKEIPI